MYKMNYYEYNKKIPLKMLLFSNLKKIEKTLHQVFITIHQTNTRNKMASEQNIQPIESVLSRSLISITLKDILEDIDLDNYENAKTKYRKPCYQRDLKKPTSWGKKLVESVLEGMSIGSFHLSVWSDIIKNDNGKDTIDNWFNIEDGQTRLNSLLEFKNGDFSTKYGCYKDEHIKLIFDTYSVPVIQLSMKNSTVNDDDYFRQLNENFSRLQDGTQLTPSDRYWAWYESSSSGFSGSPLVNLTVSLVNDERFQDLFKKYMKVNNLQRRNEGRKHLADMIGLISGAWKGVDYANSKYYSHVDIIQEEISQDDQERIETILFDIQDIIWRALEEKRKYKGEMLGPMFKTTQKFTGAIMTHLEECIDDEEKTSIKEMWVSFINEYRENKEKNDEKVWINKIYINLSDGHKRNSSMEDFKARLDCVKKWHFEIKNLHN